MAKSQVSVPAVIAQPGTGGSIAQVTPAGSVSATWTSWTTPGPALVTVIVKAAVSPGMIGLLSADFVTVTSGQRTTISAWDELLPVADCGSFVADTVTMFGSVPQSKWSVWPLTWITTLALAARLAKSQVSVPAAMAQPGTAGLIAQATPAGRTSLTWTLAAAPGPALLTVMVNAADSPALIGLLSAVLTTETSGHWTTTEAVAWPPPSLPEETVAVLLIVAQSVASV